jgi:hypothetical protein
MKEKLDCLWNGPPDIGEVLSATRGVLLTAWHDSGCIHCDAIFGALTIGGDVALEIWMQDLGVPLEKQPVWEHFKDHWTHMVINGVTLYAGRASVDLAGSCGTAVILEVFV